MCARVKFTFHFSCEQELCLRCNLRASAQLTSMLMHSDCIYICVCMSAISFVREMSKITLYDFNLAARRVLLRLCASGHARRRTICFFDGTRV